MRSFIRLFFKTFAVLFLMLMLYIFIILTVGTCNDFQPPQQMDQASIQASSQTILEDSIFTFTSWNVGYGGLGHNMGFFFDAVTEYHSEGYLVRDTEEAVNFNIQGALDYLSQTNHDFYLFQEVDVNSKRSYYINQLEKYAAIKKDFATYLAVNFDVAYSPIPLLEPWKSYGKCYGGLGTLSRFQPKEAKRLQLPGSFDWPDRIFHLDRCIGLLRYPLTSGKELVVLNIHNSAYDKGGFIKKQQIKYFKDLILKEYTKGNYVIAGGDWNQCPPDFAFDTLMPGESAGYTQINIKKDLLPTNWRWIYDPSTATNRKTSEPYNRKTTFKTVIDFFLVSPNVEVLEVKGVDQDFQFSDHQPVEMKVKLQ